jgi:hypothetical protein
MVYHPLYHIPTKHPGHKKERLPAEEQPLYKNVVARSCGKSVSGSLTHSMALFLHRAIIT